MADGNDNGVKRTATVAGLLASLVVLLAATFGGGRVVAVDLWGLAPRAYVDAADSTLAADHARDMTADTARSALQARLTRYLACRANALDEGHDPTACRTHLRPGDLPALPERER